MAVDNWEHIINLMTGFTLGERGDIMGAKGDGGIPWLAVDIENHGGLALSPANQWPKNDGQGVWIQFYGRHGNRVSKYEANVSFTDTTAGRHYWQRSADALRSLVQPPYKTLGVSSNYGGSPSVDTGVDLTSFTTLAQSFDTAGAFFNQHAEILKQWSESLGDQNASWKGTAAGVFWNLVNQLYDKYENFKSELAPPGFSPSFTSVSTGYNARTLHGDSLLQAERALHTALSNMYDQFMRFISRSATPIPVTHPDGTQSSMNVDGDTRNVLNHLMSEVAQWVQTYNTSNVKFSQRRGLVPDDGFQDTTVWGNLRDQSTWSAIAAEAQYRWRVNVETNLDVPARQEVQTLQETWSRVLNPGWNTAFAFDDTSTVTLTQAVQNDKLESDAANGGSDNEAFNDAINDLGNKFNEGLNNLGNDLGDFGDDIGNGINDLGNNFSEGMNNLGDNFGDFGDNLSDGMNDLGSSLGDFGNDLSGGMDDLGNSLSDGVNDLGGNLDDALGGLNDPASGLPTGTDALGDLPTGTDALGDLPTGTDALGDLPTGTDALGDLPDPNSFATDSTGGMDLNGDGVPDTSGTPGTEIPLGDGSNALGALPGVIPPLAPGSNPVPTGVNGLGDDPFTNVGPDGSVSTLNPDGSLTTEYPDGSSTTVSPNGEITTTDPDGSVSTDQLAPGQSLLNPDGSVTSIDSNGDITTQFPDGSSLTHNADGSVTSTDADGNVTTEYPDGSSTTVSPDGEVSITDPSGAISTDQLAPGESLINPDGSVSSVDADGNITTEYPDGTSVTHNADGSITNTDADGNEVTTMPNGVVGTTTPEGLTQLTTPDGTVSTQNPDGSLTMDFPDGSATTVNPDGTVTTTTANGSEVTSELGEGQSLVNPDGSRTSITPDGGFTTTYPDGSSVTVNPDGTVSSTPPTTSGLGTGTGTNTGSGSGLGLLPSLGGGTNGIDIPTTGSGGGVDLPSYDPAGLTTQNGDGSLSTTYPSGTTSITGTDGLTTTNFPDGSSTISSPDGELQAVPSPETAALGSSVAQPLGSSVPSVPPSGGTGDEAGFSALGGLMSPMMMMMGMARMANQGGQGQGQNERTRETYLDNDADGAFLAANGYQQRPEPAQVPEAFEEEDQDPDEVPSRTPTTGQGGMPGESGGGWRPETQDSGWDEEDDVWGTGEEGLPASIGR
ncbi:AAWKG family protein [Streptomyces sp. NPDC048290]|uniref:AAWKG family protein n=1 Tax=Streptomyces sp. NPDC048290 TaxID=3155811 RepID=UPI00342E21E0